MSAPSSFFPNPNLQLETREESCTDLDHCPIDCKLSEWSSPQCPAVGCGGTITIYKTRYIVVKSEHGGKECGPLQGEAITCQGKPCPTPSQSNNDVIPDWGYGDTTVPNEFYDLRDCYARSSLVSLAGGKVIQMGDLRVGQLVQVTDPAGIQGTSKFIGWSDNLFTLQTFRQLTTESGNVLTITGFLIDDPVNPSDLIFQGIMGFSSGRMDQ